MIISTKSFSQIEINRYLSSLKKKMTNFFNKSPLVISMVFYPQTVEIFNSKFKEKFSIDYSKDIKQFIFEIKTKLSEYYPTFTYTDVIKEDLSDEEIVEMINTNPELGSSVITYKKEKTIVYNYKVDKRIDQYNELILIDLNTNESSIWTFSSLPVSIFLNELENNKKEAEVKFAEKAIFKKFINKLKD